jgi:hypothetical protein
MYKKSLFLGAVVLALTVLLALVGCSNPTSESGPAPQTVGAVEYPPGTVFTDDFVDLEGLLYNPPETETNRVIYVAYSGTLDAELTIPDGKTVYWQNALTFATENIIVEPGARLVLEDDVTTVPAGVLLVKGIVEVHAELAVTASVLEVADYFKAGTTIEARGTVIGTGRILVAPTGTLIITADDIANQATPDRFTPAQAWAAAGQGSLQIGTNGAPLSSVYTVRYVLEGIGLPAGARTYTVFTNGGDVLPPVIPGGAFITTNGVIEDADGHNLTVNGVLIAPNAASTFEDIVNLTVNGGLIANSATFENVENLIVSGRDTDNLTSRVSDTPSETWVWQHGSYLGADSATLEKAVNITIGDYGEFASESNQINLPVGAKIILGRSAIFNSLGTINNSFDNLTRLFIGPAAQVTIASSMLTFKSLESLTLQDSASLIANAGTSVTFLVEATPSTPPRKTAINLGLNALYTVGLDPSAKVDVGIINDSSLRAGSDITLNEGSTFTLAAGKTLTVETNATIDFSNLTTVPANAADAPVKINGTIEFKDDGTGTGGFLGPNPGLFTTATDIYKVAAFGSDGALVFNHGTTYVFAESIDPAYAEVPYIGRSSTSSPFTWNSGDDGAQIIIDGTGIKIRDTNGGSAAVFVKDAGAFILKEQTLYLDTNVELQLSGNAIWFAGDAAGGAQLKGPGKVTMANGNTTITGGSNGWRVFGPDNVGIFDLGATTVIQTLASGNTTSFRAQGPSAVITQAAGDGSNSLTIAANTIVDLVGTATSPGGSIVLQSGTDPGKLTFTANTSKLLLGPGAGGAATGALVNLAIGGKAIVNASLVSADFVVLAGKLVVLGGTTASNITASTGASPDNDVAIVSNAVFTNTP